MKVPKKLRISPSERWAYEIGEEPPESFVVDPDGLRPTRELVAKVRLRRRLRQLTLRLAEGQIREAVRLADELGIGYQTVLRLWIAEGAARARSRRESARSR
jgi:hypothetical protein